MRQSAQFLFSAAFAAVVLSTGLLTGVVSAFDHVSDQAVQAAQAAQTAAAGTQS